MRDTSGRASLLLLMVFLILRLPAEAVPAITCHCFTDRSYDPARPAVADPYFLATTQNSFIAAAFGVDKKNIVIKKQKGVSSEDLWISCWLAERSGAEADLLLQERKTKGSWRQVASSLPNREKSQGGRVSELLKTASTDERLAGAVIDELLVSLRIHSDQELISLRKAGAGSQELVLSGLISAKSRQPALQVYREVKGGSASWGAMLQRAKIDPATIHSEIALLVSSGGKPRLK